MDCDDIYFLKHEEVGKLARAEDGSFDVTTVVATRREAFASDAELRLTIFTAAYQNHVLHRHPYFLLYLRCRYSCLTGVAEGKARVVRSLDDAGRLQAGEILLCVSTDVGWTPYFALAKAVVTEIGGMLSHGAVVAREYGLPCVVNAKGVCDAFADGVNLRVDANNGIISQI